VRNANNLAKLLLTYHFSFKGLGQRWGEGGSAMMGPQFQTASAVYGGARDASWGGGRGRVGLCGNITTTRKPGMSGPRSNTRRSAAYQKYPIY